MARRDKVKVVLFCGGSGAQVLSKELVNGPQVALTLAINGYDDGLSTGEIRRLLGNCLGPSDFRKNASILALALQSCRRELVELIDMRLPKDCTRAEGIVSLRLIRGASVNGTSQFHNELSNLIDGVDEDTRRSVARRLHHFEKELEKDRYPFSFSDCSIGNIVFGGCFVRMGGQFNAAISDYCGILNLSDGVIENVTDGTNAFLVGVDRENGIVGSESEIVDGKKRRNIKDIYLIDRPLSEEDRMLLASVPAEHIDRFLDERSKIVSANPRLLERIAEADLIIYAPGTQHSSLFPSYLTPGIGMTIARNLKAVKLLVTNIREDAEIIDTSAVDLINKAVYYLMEKGRQRIPTPCLITHYLVNDPNRGDESVPYVPLGRLETLEDPRLVRIANYEEGTTGRHNAAMILTPFVESFLNRKYIPNIGILLLETDSLHTISQTIMELLRAGIESVPVSITVFYQSTDSFNQVFTQALPFEIRNVYDDRKSAETGFSPVLGDMNYDYFILFESSGMYKGDDIVNVASLLGHGRLDAVWGSRRLSVKDIRESYKLRYRHNMILGTFSYLGSHLLSLTYLMLTGRYISDTLSGVRAIRASYLRSPCIDLNHKYVNQHILSILTRDHAEIYETPIQFFPMSPEKVRRTTILDGLQSLFIILSWRLKSLRSQNSPADGYKRIASARHSMQTLKGQEQKSDPEVVGSPM